MTPIGSAAGIPPAPTDPRELALHLEICRLQAELEDLEDRIRQVEAARTAGTSGYDPFIERAEELVERMVASLYVTGRAEIAEATAASDREAEAVIAEARRRAQAILAEARGELASVLVDRADAVDAAGAGTPAVLDLTEPDRSGTLAADDGAIDLVDDGAVGPGDTSDASGPVIASPAPDEPTGDGTTGDLADPSVSVGPNPVEHGSPAFTPSAARVPSDMVSSLEAIAPHLPPPPARSAAAAASDRTDAAFDAWLAVGPPAPAVEAAGEPEPDVVPEGRPGWVRPLEAVIALVTIAVVVIIALLLVG